MPELRRFATCREFLATTGEFLAAREAEHCLMLGLCSLIVAHPEVYPDPWFVAVLDGERVVGAALQTPPHNVVLSEMDAAHVEQIVDALVARLVPGVLGPTQVAACFADRWQARTGSSGRVVMRERVFRLDRVIAPCTVAGTLRIAGAADRELLADWIAAFHAEALPDTPVHGGRYEVADRWIKRVGKTIYFWEDGEVVAMAGAGGETPNGTRIGPVYTPPARRGRGYASNAVAAVTRHQLDAGRRFCFLFTDLANPTSNKIYQALGYVAVTDVDQYQF